jgi:hypothetical protein
MSIATISVSATTFALIDRLPASGPTTAEKIKSFANLPVGWHYGRGTPASKEMVRVALQRYWNLQMLGYVETDAFPGVDGEVMVTCYRGRHCLEITAEVDGTFAVAHQCGGKEDFYENGLSVEDANFAVWSLTAKIEREEQEECDISSWSISNTMTLEPVNSKTWRSNHQATEVARP